MVKKPEFISPPSYAFRPYQKLSNSQYILNTLILLLESPDIFYKLGE